MLLPNQCSYASHQRIHQHKSPYTCPECGAICRSVHFQSHVTKNCLHYTRRVGFRSVCRSLITALRFDGPVHTCPSQGYLVVLREPSPSVVELIRSNPLMPCWPCRSIQMRTGGEVNACLELGRGLRILSPHCTYCPSHLSPVGIPCISVPFTAPFLTSADRRECCNHTEGSGE